MKPHRIVLPIVCIAAALSACGTATPRSDSVGSAPRALAGCTATSVQVPIAVTPSPPSIDVPGTVCVSTPGFFGQGSVSWTLPVGYTFPDGPDCVTFKSIGGWAGGGSSASGGVCTANLWAVTSANWVYTLHFQTTGILSKKWTCDPTIINRDFGFDNTKAAAADVVRCDVVQ